MLGHCAGTGAGPDGVGQEADRTLNEEAIKLQAMIPVIHKLMLVIAEKHNHRNPVFNHCNQQQKALVF